MRKNLTSLSSISCFTGSIGRCAPKISTICSPSVSGKYTRTRAEKRFFGTSIMQ